MTRQEFLKHKETINAWANKAQIEYLSLQGVWTDCSNPRWLVDTEYRVKPVPTFEVGDKVLFFKEWENHNIKFCEDFKKVIGKIGTVIHINPFNGCNVKFDDFMWLYGDSLAIPNECLQSVGYVPFDFKDNLVGMKVKHKTSNYIALILAQTEQNISLQGDGWLSFQELFDSYIFTSDGSPCGKLKQ